jgi:3-oxoacyl-[acyl-carrier protein] reductase
MPKIAVVTGSSSGLGLDLSLNLLHKEWRVYGIDIAPPPDSLNSELYSHHLCDLSDFDQISDISKGISGDITCLDMLVNCAGIMPTSLVARLNAIDADQTYKINAIAPLLLSKLFLKKLRNSGNPRIINIASIAAELTIPGEAIYASSKAALKHSTSILAIEYARYNIAVFTVSPALIKTPMTQHLSEQQQLDMLRKQAIPFDAKPADFTNVILGILNLPFSSTGSTIYVGGIAN